MKGKHRITWRECDWYFHIDGQACSSRPKPMENTLQAVCERYDSDFDNWWRQYYGYGLKEFTESELRYLARVKAPSADAIRDRILAAR